MHQTLLSLHNVSKVYHTAPQPFYALKKVSFSLYKGEILALLGVNGAGKTTLSSIIATVHPPSEGKVIWNGHPINEQLYEYRRIIGLCPQYSNLDSLFDVKMNLLYAGMFYGLSKHEAEERALTLLKEYSLEMYKDSSIASLSGGCRQRLLIARSLMHNPSLVILDEPTVGLDPDIRRQLWEYIRALRDKGVTVILTTHYLDEAEYLADRICLLHRGSVKRIQALNELKKEHDNMSLENIFINLTHEYNKNHE